MVPQHTLRPTRLPPYSLPTCSGPQPVCHSHTIPSHPHHCISPLMLTCHGIRTPAPPPHATHSHTTPLLPPLVSHLAPPLPPSMHLSLDAHAPWHTHTHTSTTCNATCLQSRDHSSGVFCSPSLLSNICSCYPQLPTPRPGTPKPKLKPASNNFARPCPTCHTGNAYS